MTLAHGYGRVHCDIPMRYLRLWFGYQLASEAVEADVAHMVREKLGQMDE